MTSVKAPLQGLEFSTPLLFRILVTSNYFLQPRAATSNLLLCHTPEDPIDIGKSRISKRESVYGQEADGCAANLTGHLIALIIGSHADVLKERLRYDSKTAPTAGETNTVGTTGLSR